MYRKYLFIPLTFENKQLIYIITFISAAARDVGIDGAAKEEEDDDDRQEEERIGFDLI